MIAQIEKFVKNLGDYFGDYWGLFWGLDIDFHAISFAVKAALSLDYKGFSGFFEIHAIYVCNVSDSEGHRFESCRAYRPGSQ